MTTENDIWTPSDKLLLQDPDAERRILTPGDAVPVDGDDEDDAANETAAAFVLAEARGDEPAEGFNGAADDDDDDADE